MQNASRLNKEKKTYTLFYIVGAFYGCQSAWPGQLTISRECPAAVQKVFGRLITVAILHTIKKRTDLFIDSDGGDDDSWDVPHSPRRDGCDLVKSGGEVCSQKAKPALHGFCCRSFCAGDASGNKGCISPILGCSGLKGRACVGFVG